MTADDLETDVCCFFVIVVSRLDCFCKYNNPKGGSNYVIRQQNSLSRCIQGQI